MGTIENAIGKQARVLFSLAQQEDLKARANREAELAYAPKLASIDENYAAQQAQLQKSKNLAKEDTALAQQNIQSEYQKQRLQDENEVLRRGMARSSVALNMLEENQKGEAGALERLWLSNSNRLAELGDEEQRLLVQMNNAKQQANFEKALDARARLDKLYDESDKRQREMDAIERELAWQREKLDKEQSFEREKLEKEQNFERSQKASEEALAREKLALQNKSASSAPVSDESYQIYEELRKDLLNMNNPDMAINELMSDPVNRKTLGEYYTVLLNELQFIRNTQYQTHRGQ